MMKKPTCAEVRKHYGIDPSQIHGSTYYINEDTDMLVVTSKTKVAFEGEVKPKETIYGSFADTYFYYFKKLKETK